MRAVVTGAAGFIGSHLVSGLLDRGFEVVGVDCFTDYYPRPLKEANLDVNRTRKGFSFVEARLQDADLQAILDGATHVFHLAAQAGVRKSWGSDFRIYTSNNVDASQQLLEACVNRKLHRFVYASSSSLYGDNVSIPMREDALPQPVSPYGVTKLAAEQLCYLYKVNHGVPTTALGISPCMDRVSVPTWPSIGSFAHRSTGSRSRFTATANRHATSRSSPTLSRRRWRPATRACPGGPITSAAARASP